MARHRWAAAAIALTAALFGFSAFYSDLGAAHPWWARVLVALAVVGAGAALAAYLASRWWYGLVAGAGPLAAAAVLFVLQGPEATSWAAAVACAVALLGSWTGSRLAVSRARGS